MIFRMHVVIGAWLLQACAANGAIISLHGSAAMRSRNVAASELIQLGESLGGSRIEPSRLRQTDLTDSDSARQTIPRPAKTDEADDAMLRSPPPTLPPRQERRRKCTQETVERGRPRP